MPTYFMHHGMRGPRGPRVPTRVEARSVAVVDVETTGLVPGYHEIVQVAIVRLDDPALEPKTWFVRPERTDNIDPWVKENISIDMDAPLFAEVQEEIWQELQGRALAGQNVSFDEAFLNAAFEPHNRKVPYHKVDLATLSWLLIPHKLESLSLAAVCKALDVKLDNAHTASADAVATAECIALLVGQYKAVAAGNGVAAGL